MSTIDSKAPARIRLCARSGRICRKTPRLARMNENSPICARLAAIVMPVRFE